MIRRIAPPLSVLLPIAMFTGCYSGYPGADNPFAEEGGPLDEGGSDAGTDGEGDDGNGDGGQGSGGGDGGGGDGADDSADGESDGGRPDSGDGDGGAAGEDDPADSDGGGSTGEPIDPESGTGAADISLGAIEVNQGVAIPVMSGGNLIAEANRNAPLVRNRHMLVRATWQTGAQFVPRQIEGRLTLDYGGGEVEVVSDIVNVTGPSNTASLGGTFSFILEPEQVRPQMAFSVALFEVGDDSSGAATPPRFPEQGTVDMGVPSTRMQVGLTIVPYRVGNSSPNLSPEAQQVFREYFYARKPIEFGEEGLRIRIYPQEQVASSANAQVVLDPVCSLWSNDVNSGVVSSSEYYHSAIASSTVSGTLGVAYVLNGNFGSRCGSNLWNSNLTQGPSTMTHEIGHNMGRQHAPCGFVGSSDASYPYSGGLIGVQGWNPVSGELIPSTSADYMGYCNSSWTSDYSYRLNAERTASLQLGADVVGPSPSAVVQLIGHEFTDGRQQWSVDKGRRPEPGLPIAGRARVWTIDGKALDVDLYRRKLSQGSAVVAVIPGIDSADDVARVESDVFSVKVDTVPKRFMP